MLCATDVYDNEVLAVYERIARDSFTAEHVVVLRLSDIKILCDDYAENPYIGHLPAAYALRDVLGRPGTVLWRNFPVYWDTDKKLYYIISPNQRLYGLPREAGLTKSDTRLETFRLSDYGIHIRFLVGVSQPAIRRELLVAMDHTVFSKIATAVIGIRSDWRNAARTFANQSLSAKVIRRFCCSAIPTDTTFDTDLPSFPTVVEERIRDLPPDG